MKTPPRRREYRPSLDALEARALLTAIPPGFLARWNLGDLPALIGRANPADGNGVAAITSALRGGPGSEFTDLIRQSRVNVGRIIRDFAAGARAEFAIPGFAVRTPQLRAEYAGPRFDQFNPTASGVVRLRDGSMTLGAIMRGPIDMPLASDYVWAFDRGLGAARPVFDGPADPRADLIVTVSRSADGSTTARFHDLATGHADDLPSAWTQVQGPTVRLRLDPGVASALGISAPSTRFAFWTEGGETQGLSRVGQFLPAGTIPIGVLAGRARR